MIAAYATKFNIGLPNKINTPKPINIPPDQDDNSPSFSFIVSTITYQTYIDLLYRLIITLPSTTQF